MIGKKILITGLTGMLGFNLKKYLTNTNIVGFGSEIDITNMNLVHEKLSGEKPDIIIHTAAFTNVEACEIDRDKAYKINSLGTQNLVNYAIDKEILFIFISSTGIYGNLKNEAYTEFDRVFPSSFHHKSKYEAEKIVKNHLSKFLILRTGWLYGGEKTHSKNFVYQRILESEDKEKIYSDNSQIGNPTFVKDFIAQIEILINSKQYGVFNCVNRAVSISRFDYVKKIIELSKINCSVEVAEKGMFTRIAPVSPNESAENYKLNLLGLNVMRNWDKALSSYIEELFHV